MLLLGCFKQVNLVKSNMRRPCWAFPEHQPHQPLSEQQAFSRHAFIWFIDMLAFNSNMRSFMAVLFNLCKVTSLLGQDLMDSFTWLRELLSIS